MSVTDKYMEAAFADDTDPNAIKEPEKRWLNWWKCIWPSGGIGRNRAEIAYGQAKSQAKVFPSKDAAETEAAKLMEIESTRMGLQYLGAFPEGERP